MKYWLISDPHFGHEMLIKKGYRPANFENTILKNLSVVGWNDILICLGDFAFYKLEYWHDKFFDVLGCKTWLIKGNHDRNTNSWYLDHGWDFVCDKFTMRYGGHNITFSHIPEHVFWDDINIHGHCHEKERYDYDFMEGREDQFKLISMELNDYKPITLNKLLGMRKNIK